MPAVPTRQFYGAGPGDLPVLHRHDLANAKRLHHRQRRIKPASGKRCDLFRRARLHHHGEAAVDPVIDVRAWRHHGKPRCLAGNGPFMRIGLPGADRPPGGADNTHGTDQALAVTIEQPFRRLRVQPGKGGAEGSPAISRNFVEAGLVDVRRHLGNGGDTVTGCLQIHAGTANHDRQPSCQARGLHLCRQQIKPGGDGGALAPIDNAIKPVRCLRLVFRVRPSRDHTKVTIDLHGIGVDHRATPGFGERQRKAGLAGRGRPADHQVASCRHRIRDFTVVSHSVLCFTVPLMSRPGKGREPLHQTVIFSSSAHSDVTPDVARGILASVGITADSANARILADGRAVDIALADMPPGTETGTGTGSLAAQLRKAGDALHIDVNLVLPDNRRKRLLIADMDSTVITTESLDDMARIAGMEKDILPITARAMRGELDFEQALDARLALLAGQPAQLVDDALDEAELTPGAVTLVRTMRAAGAACYLVSGGFTAITGPVAAQCGFHGTHANHLEIEDGVLLGTVRKPVLDRDSKAHYLAHYCTALGITAEDAACIGDGANDLAMLQASGFGVAFQGKPLLREQVTLQMNHTDLTGLLYLQGFTEAEFTSG